MSGATSPAGGGTGAGSPGAVPRLHAVAGPEEAERAGFPGVVRRLFEACGPRGAVHLRLPDASGRRLFELAEAVEAAASGTGGWCVVNGRPDVALAAGARAVQLGRRAIPVEDAVALVGGRIAVGASVHGAREAAEAARAGANYLLLGTIYATPSHPGRPGSGPALVRAARRELERAGLGAVPLLAIGGIDASNAPEVRAAGAAGVAVRRAVWAASDPAEAALALLGATAGPAPGTRRPRERGQGRPGEGGSE